MSLAQRCALALALACLTLPACAAYPEHIITGLVPFDVGGGADIFARLVAPQLSKALGQNVVIENKGGAAGNIGMALLAQSRPNGYTILFNGAAAGENPALFRHLPYDPLTDIEAVGELAESPYMIAVNTLKVAATSLADFIGLLRRAPGKFNVGAGGGGQRVPVALFLQQNNLDVQIVPYNGTGPTLTALLSGEIDFAILAPGPLTTVAGSGKIRLLATSGEERSPRFPAVPTTAQAGMPGYRVADSFAVYIRRGTPPEITHRLNAALNEAMGDAGVADKFRALGFTIVRKTAEEAEKNYLSEVALWKGVAARAHIAPLD